MPMKISSKVDKMVLPRIMLTHGEENMLAPIRPEDVAQSFHTFYMAKEYRRNIDFSERRNRSGSLTKREPPV
ncbi:hypothetical protein [Bacillus piscicola]|uniref:hypothetical protein n=1 Tax=Bacillus piscicola TaxID=1632684 RepID=UPI001F09EC89|nr:hypothetical protein [Bacillus piscicola]